MATDVILPALGMSQDTGKIVQWLKTEGQRVSKGEPLAEIETDKATVEIESPAGGVLARVSASEGDDVPVGQVIAVILAPDEAAGQEVREAREVPGAMASQNGNTALPQVDTIIQASVPLSATASPLAQRIAGEHHLDLSQVKSAGRRIQKADVLAYIQEQAGEMTSAGAMPLPRLSMASPKARRLASEQGIDLLSLNGSGPGGAVLAADVLAYAAQSAPSARSQREQVSSPGAALAQAAGQELPLSHVWRVMAERTTQSWTTAPHFYLVREVNASQLISWRERMLKRSSEKITYTDLLVKVVAAALKAHPRVNASWREGRVLLNDEVHVGLAVATGEGLVVPVIHHADALGLGELARQRKDLVARAQAGKLHPQDISGGTFTISNLGMYNVDAFNAIINAPQAAILAVGRIAERVVPVRGQPAVQPIMTLTLSCDHRAVDGARGAQFLDTVTNLLEDPLGLLD